MFFIILTGILVGCYLAWSYCAAANYPVPHMSDTEEEDDYSN